MLHLQGAKGDDITTTQQQNPDPIHFLYLGCLTGAKRREWMGMGVAGIIINSYCGSFPHSLLSTGKMLLVCNRISKIPSHSRRLPQHPVADAWNVTVGQWMSYYQKTSGEKNHRTTINQAPFPRFINFLSSFCVIKRASPMRLFLLLCCGPYQLGSRPTVDSERESQCRWD